uniref:Uncharacterized protein n=1 Tax=Arundo donax TaxID=35708 RepID=A0A0A9A6R6_ARUDO
MFRNVFLKLLYVILATKCLENSCMNCNFLLITV